MSQYKDRIHDVPVLSLRRVRNRGLKLLSMCTEAIVEKAGVDGRVSSESLLPCEKRDAAFKLSPSNDVTLELPPRPNQGAFKIPPPSNDAAKDASNSVAEIFVKRISSMLSDVIPNPQHPIMLLNMSSAGITYVKRGLEDVATMIACISPFLGSRIHPPESPYSVIQSQRLL